MYIIQLSCGRGLDCNSTQSLQALGTAIALRVSTKGLMRFLSDVRREVYRSLRRRTRTSPSPEPFVERKETNTEQLLALPLTPQLANKRCSQRDKVFPHAASMSRSWVRTIPFVRLLNREPCVLLASELTDCLAQGFLNRALCLALIVSGDGVAFMALPRMWRSELASSRKTDR